MNSKQIQLKYNKALEYEIFTKGEYNFAKNRIQDAKCIFDVWWHIWLFSKRCRNLNPNAEIHYFEPVGEFYNETKKTLWNEKNIILNNYWISSKTENWTILLNQEKTMQSSKYSSFLNPRWNEIAVNFITLKDYLELKNLDKIDVLKMDIEWMEFEVLNSLWNFEREKIENLIIEIHLLNEVVELERKQLYIRLNKIFWNVKLINTWYRKEIFLVWANK